MARPVRVELPGALYWVTARTLPRHKLYRNEGELEDLLGRLPELAAAFGAVFHGLCALPSGYNLLVETPRANLSRVMHRLNAGYTATVNARRRRKGPLLQTRYRSILFDEDPWLLRLSVFVHLEPVRRRLATDPWAYPGSSARAFGDPPAPVPGIATDRVLALAGGRAAYARLLGEAVRDPPEPPGKHVWRQVALGGEALKRRVRAALEGRDVREAPGFAAPGKGLTLDAVLGVVAEHTGLPPDQIVRGKFQRVLARKAAIYLARRYTDLRLREIGAAFGVDYTTVHMAARRVEELRARDPGVDAFLEAVEADLSTREGAASPPEPAPTAAVEAGVDPPRETGPSPSRKRPRQTRARSAHGQLELF